MEHQTEALWDYIAKLEKMIERLDQKLYDAQRELEYRIDDTERKLQYDIAEAKRRSY